jgi:hypothetical protein
VTRVAFLFALCPSLLLPVACGGSSADGKGGHAFGGASTTASGGAGGAGGGHATTTPTGGGGSACHDGDACVVPGKLGVCAKGTTKCGATGTSCVAPKPGKETCNGADDNCDGVTDEGCQVVVEVRKPDGTSTAALPTTTFPPGGKAMAGLDTVFGADPGDGWLSITSDSPLPLLGVWAVVPGATPTPTHVLTPTASPKSAQKTHFFPAYRFGGPDALAHAVSLVNDGDADATVKVHVLPDGAPAETAVDVVVPAHGTWRSDAPTLLADGAAQGAGWLSVDSSAPLVAAFESWGKATDRAAEAAWPAPAKKLTIPVVAVGGKYDTRVLVATRSALAVTVTARFHGPGGTTPPATFMVNAGARAEASLGTDVFPSTFQEATTGWLELSADAEIGALAEIHDGDHAGLALVGPVDAPAEVLYLADAAIGDGVSTHLVLANPSDADAQVTLEAFAADGTPARRVGALVPGGGAWAGSLADLLGLATFDGYVRVACATPITGGSIRHDGAQGVGATALQAGQGGRAIVPVARSIQGPERTIVTIIQPERRAFSTP